MAIGLEDIAGISSPEEGRAVGLALFNQLQALQPQQTESGKPIEITPALLAKRRKIAEAATPGPWAVETTALIGRNGKTASWVIKNELPLQMNDAEGEANAAHIAENSPDKVLQLLDLISELADGLQSMATQYSCVCKYRNCKGCQNDRLNREVLQKVKGGVE